MSLELWREIQEGLLYAIGPLLFWWLVFLVVGTLVSAIGVLIFGNLPKIDPLD